VSFGGQAFNAMRLTAINGKSGVASSVKSLRAVSAPATMRPSLIRKDPSLFRVRPHLADWAQASRDFRWDDARRQLAGLPGGHVGDVSLIHLQDHPVGIERRHLEQDLPRSTGEPSAWLRSPSTTTPSKGARTVVRAN